LLKVFICFICCFCCCRHHRHRSCTEHCNV